MIIFFLLIIMFINNVFAKNQSIGFYIKDLNLGGKVMGLILTYFFFIITILFSYKVLGENLLLNSIVFIVGSIINYFLYEVFLNYYNKKYLTEYNENKFLFLLKHKNNFFEEINKNFIIFDLDEKHLEEIKRLKIIKGGIIGDSLLLPYEFLKKEKTQKRYFKYGLRQSLISDYGITSDDSDHLIITYNTINRTNNVIDFQKELAKKLKFWLFTIPVGIGFTTIKATMKLLLGFPPNKSGINSLGNGPLMRVSSIATFFFNNKIKRDEYIKASTEITHNNPEAIKMTQLIGNVIAYIYEKNKKPIKEDLIKLLECEENSLTGSYINLLLNNLNNNLENFLNSINANKKITAYIMTSSIFILYVLYNAKNYKEAFEMIIKASGDTDTIGAIIGSVFSILDEDL